MSEFVEHVSDAMSAYGEVTPKRMFGGWGIFHEGLMIGLIADGSLYLKTDAAADPYFDEWDLPNFEYAKSDKVVSMSFRLAPDAMLERPDAAREWTEIAYQAAFRSKKKPSYPRRGKSGR